MWLEWQKVVAEQVFDAVGSLIGDRYYIGYIPEDHTYPYIYTPVDFSTSHQHIMGFTPMYDFPWQFTIWCDFKNGGPMKVLEIFEKLYEELGDNLFTVPGYEHISFLSQMQTTVGQDKENPGLFHQILIYRVILQKEV